MAYNVVFCTSICWGFSSPKSNFRQTWIVIRSKNDYEGGMVVGQSEEGGEDSVFRGGADGVVGGDVVACHGGYKRRGGDVFIDF